MTRRFPSVGWLTVVGPLLLGAEPQPDLAVRRDGLVRSGERIAVVVENRGDASSPPTEVELSDRSPLLGPAGRSAPYPRISNRRKAWIRQEPLGADSVAVTIELGNDGDRGYPSGEFRLLRGAALVLPDDPPGVTCSDDERGLRWEGAALGGLPGLRIHVPAVRGDPPVALVRFDSEGDDHTEIVTAGGSRPGSANLRLDALECDATRPRRIAVPRLAPGERFHAEVDLPGGAQGETFAVVDPDDTIAEVREGNNVSSIRNDAADVTQAALHLHSSFSEGAGSVDFQVGMAARSGYDLLWWTEHDWRIDCYDHVTTMDFEVQADASPSTRELGERVIRGAGVVALDPGEARSGRSSLRLAVPGEEAGVAGVRLDPRRKRLTYTLAARIDIELDVYLREFGDADVLRLGVELSRHGTGVRELRYEVHVPGEAPPVVPPPPAWPGQPPVDPVVRIARPTAHGGWVRLTLPVSRDAAAAWTNGLDDSITGLELRLVSAEGGADVRIDDLRVAHGECGETLRRIQLEWMEDYPNVAHAFGEEISFVQPHFNQYGGRRGLIDYARVTEEELGAADVVERIHRANAAVAWCHPFGLITNRKTMARFGKVFRDSIVDRAFHGADMLEVGFRNKAGSQLREYLEFWDRAGKAGTFITGIGVNDSHERQWGPGENNFGTWIEGPADRPDVLLRALKEGRVFFGDPTAFRGRVTLRSAGAGPGATVSGASPRPVTVEVTGAPAGARVDLVVGGAVFASWSVEDGSGRWTVEVPGGGHRTVRAEVWKGRNAPLAFTNPILFRGGD